MTRARRDKKRALREAKMLREMLRAYQSTEARSDQTGDAARDLFGLPDDATPDAAQRRAAKAVLFAERYGCKGPIGVPYKKLSQEDLRALRAAGSVAGYIKEYGTLKSSP